MTEDRKSSIDLGRLRAFLTTEYVALSVIVSVCVLLFVFLRIADVATGADSHALDIAIIEMFREADNPSQMIGSFWFREAVRDITALGSFSVLTIVVLLVVAYLLLTRQRGGAMLVLVSVLSGAALSEWLKSFFERPRPEYSEIALEMSASFPSGHAMLSAATYLTLGALLSRMTPRKRLRALYIGTAVVLTVLIGTSRVMMGVHYPSDVLAGWALGAAWAIGCSAIAYYLGRRGAI
jgi:undecaprenyl-diphosphatase